MYLGTDPKVKNAPAARPDGDGDGLYDDDEVNVYGTDPKVADTDKDGVSDGEEVFNKTDPRWPTTQHGGANNTAGGANNARRQRRRTNNPGGGANNGGSAGWRFLG